MHQYKLITPGINLPILSTLDPFIRSFFQWLEHYNTIFESKQTPPSILKRVEPLNAPALIYHNHGDQTHPRSPSIRLYPLPFDFLNVRGVSPLRAIPMIGIKADRRPPVAYSALIQPLSSPLPALAHVNHLCLQLQFHKRLRPNGKMMGESIYHDGHDI